MNGPDDGWKPVQSGLVDIGFNHFYDDAARGPQLVQAMARPTEGMAPAAASPTTTATGVNANTTASVQDPSSYATFDLFQSDKNRFSDSGFQAWVRMTDQLPDLMDELLRQFANENLYEKMEAKKKELERLASEIETLRQQLDELRKTPGDHRRAIADLEAKIQELIVPFDMRKDELKNTMSQFEQFMKIAASVNETLTRIVENIAQKIGR